MHDLLGKLDIQAFQHGPIETATAMGMTVTMFLVIAVVTYFRAWKWLWNNWITSLDPKRIGTMYFVVVLLMLFKGLVDAFIMRAQQVLSVGDSQGFLTATHFQQIFSAHGNTMIFFVGMGVVIGLMNWVIPLLIGARDVAFPFLNSVSFWLFAMAANLLVASLVIGEFSATGWLAYPPLSGIKYSPGVGVDYWIWILQVAGASSLLSGINFLVTIFKMRCPGMDYMKMPLFVWASAGALILIVFAFPILTATLFMLALDRYMDMHFFTSDYGGNPMLYINLIWAWGHPEVYILVLPFFGVFSEVVSTFSQKRLFGYGSMVWAIIAITVLSFLVWLHHFFTMGATPAVNAFFSIMTMLIAIPTGVKIFNWLFTMNRGRVYFTTPMLWFLGFIIVFTLGGMAGVLLSIPGVDFQVHNSLFLIAHFHSVIIGGVLFGLFAGLSYWFPKIFGFQLNETLGKYAFWFWFTGFILAFGPLYVLGFMGATRRLNHYEWDTGWHPLFVTAAVGAVFVIIGVIFQNLQVLYSVINREKTKDITGDPWNGRTLEWTTASPPPVYNFAVIPVVHDVDPFWTIKQEETPPKEIQYEDIMMPKNTAMGLYVALFSAGFAFAMVWHMFIIALLALLGVIACVIIRTWDDDVEYIIPASEVEKIEAKRSRL